MRIRGIGVAFVAVLLTAACGAPVEEVAGTAAPGQASSTGETPSAPTTGAGTDYGPFLLDDPFAVVAGVSWLDAVPALPDGPIARGGPIAVLMDDSTPDTLHIAVNGGGCRPELQVAVLNGPPDLELGIAVGDYIVEPGLQCTDLLVTHGFEVQLNQPVSLENVVLNPLLTTGDRPVTILVPGVDGSLPGDVIVSCPSGPSFPYSALQYIPPVESVDLPGLDAAMQSFLSGEEGQYWPQEGWRVLYSTDNTVLVVHLDGETDAISFMDLEFRDSVWDWSGASSGGPCPLQATLPEGLDVVTWRLDPDAPPPTPETTSIPVLATEQACASGKPMGDRLLGPDVVMTGTEVLIAFAARSQTGMQECPGNPEQAVVVELPGPLGDRTVRDGMDTGLDLGDFLK
jgi:hypothetical protein